MSDQFVENSLSVMEEYDTLWVEGYRAWGPAYAEMADDLRFYLGDQWKADDMRYLREQGRETLVINKLKSRIDWIIGYQIQNRLSSVCVPVNDSSQETADQFTKLMINDMASGGYQKISETFSAACKTRWGLCNLYLDYSNDPVNGDVKWARDPYSSFICDPYFTDLANLNDCPWLIKRKYLSPHQVENLLPGQEEEVQNLSTTGWQRDNKFTWMVPQRIPTGQKAMAYNEMWQQKTKNQEVIYNKTTGKMVDYDSDEENLRIIWGFARDQGHELEMITRKKRYVEKKIIVNNHYMRTEVNPYGLDEYPFVLITPVFESESDEYTYKVQSLVTQQKDCQREYNKRRSQMSDIVESRLNSGWVEMEGAVKNPKMLYQSGQGKRIVISREAPEGMASIREILPTNIPPSFFQEFDVNDKDIIEGLGLNPTTLGQAEMKQVSAIVEMQRQASSITGMQEIFDRLRDAQKAIGVKLIKIYQQWTPEKVAQIINEKPTQEFYDKNFSRYDCQVQEGVLTNTQRYLFFRQVLELKQIGEPIPPGELTKLAPLQGKTELIKDIEAYAQQQQQMQQQQAVASQQQAEAVGQSLQAKAVSDLALAKEREAKAISDLGLEDERVSKAVLDRQEAALAQIKGMHELVAMEESLKGQKDARTVQMFEFFKNYQEWLKQQEDEEKAKNAIQAQGLQTATPLQQNTV